MTVGPLSGASLLQRRQERLDHQTDLFQRFRQRRNHMSKAPAAESHVLTLQKRDFFRRCLYRPNIFAIKKITIAPKMPPPPSKYMSE